MRSIYTSSPCGCAAPGIVRALDRETAEKMADGQLAKGRRQPKPTAVGRYVDRRAPSVARRVAKVLKAQGKRLGAAVARQWPIMKVEAIRRPTPEEIVRAIEDGLIPAGMEDMLTPVLLDAYLRGSANGYGQIGLTFSEEALRHADAKASEYAAERGGQLIRDLAGTTRDALQSLIVRANDEGWSSDELSRAVEDSGSFGEARADTIARTELAFAHVQGNVEGWRESGEVEKKQWILGDLHDKPDECDDAADAGEVDLDDDFVDGIDFPPAHPNSVLEGSTFASYGELLQLVSAPYLGPAIVLELDRMDCGIEPIARNASVAPDICDLLPGSEGGGGALELAAVNGQRLAGAIPPQRVSLTIGPNHPMLTHRGFVAADSLDEGDELLHDALAQDSLAAAGESNLEKVMRLEDVFGALATLSGTSLVADPTGYFHGDEAFIYGEVQAVRPERGLLPILDPGGVEHLCKDALMWANANPASLTSRSAPKFRLWAIEGLPRSQGGGSDTHPIFAAHGGVPRFHRYRVVSRHDTHFVGKAFDASSVSGIYNNGGFVVKNCICDVIPVLKPAEDDS